MSTTIEEETVDTTTDTDKSSKAEAVAIFAIAFAALSILTAVFAVGIAVRAAKKADDIKAAPAAAGADAGTAVKVNLSEFKFAPSDIKVPAGGSVELTNVGTTAHDFKVDSLITNAIEAGSTIKLDLSSLAPGTYDVECTIPGHASAGMKGTLTVT